MSAVKLRVATWFIPSGAADVTKFAFVFNSGNYKTVASTSAEIASAVGGGCTGGFIYSAAIQGGNLKIIGQSFGVGTILPALMIQSGTDASNKTASFTQTVYDVEVATPLATNDLGNLIGQITLAMIDGKVGSTLDMATA